MDTLYLCQPPHAGCDSEGPSKRSAFPKSKSTRHLKQGLAPPITGIRDKVDKDALAGDPHIFKYTVQHLGYLSVNHTDFIDAGHNIAMHIIPILLTEISVMRI